MIGGNVNTSSGLDLDWLLTLNGTTKPSHLVAHRAFHLLHGSDCSARRGGRGELIRTPTTTRLRPVWQPSFFYVSETDIVNRTRSDEIVCVTDPPPFSDPAEVDAFYAQLGEAVELARKRKGWNQKKLAEHLGLSRTSITNIENGNQRITTHHLWLCSEVLGVPMPDLLPSGLEEGTLRVVKEADPEKRDQIEAALERARERLRRE